MKSGYEALKLETGQDFGYDIAAWEPYLEANHADEYCHDYGYDATRDAVQAAKNDPEVARLMSKIQSDT